MPALVRLYVRLFWRTRSQPSTDYTTFVHLSLTVLPAMSRFTRRLLLLLILAAAAALRFWQIDSIPPGFHFDESFEGLEAWRILTDPGYRPIFLMGNFGVLPLNAYANALMFGLFQFLGGEAGPTAMRMTAAFFGVAGVIAVYLLAEEIRRQDPSLPKAFPFLAAASLALMRWHIHFSRMGIEPILVPLLWAGSAWLLLRGWRRGGWLSFLGAGVLLAATMYSYQAAWIIPLLAVLLVVHLAVSDRPRLATRWPGLLAAAGLALLLLLPLGVFFWHHPDFLLLRPSQIAVVDQAGGPAERRLAANIWGTLRMFGPGQTGDLDPRRNLPGDPALNVWQVVPFYLGLGLAIWRIRRPEYALLVVGLAGLLLPGVLSEYAPHFHRILGATAPVALLTGLGLAWIWQLGSRRFRPAGTTKWPGLAATSAVILLLLLGGITAARDYFVRWAALPDLYYAFDVGLWEIGQWIAEQPADRAIYLTPRSSDHASLAFAWRPGSGSRPAPDSFDGRHIFPLKAAVGAQPEQYVVIEHEDFRTGNLLPEIFPDASIGQEIVDDQNQLYSRVYTRPAGAKPQQAPIVPLDVTLGDGIRLEGYELIPKAPSPGDILFVRFHWLADARPAADWTVFVHLLGQSKADGSRLWVGKDGPPGAGSLPTSRWQPGWRIIDEYALPLPADLPSGVYEIEAGMYQTDGQRLPARAEALPLGVIQVGATESGD